MNFAASLLNCQLRKGFASETNAQSGLRTVVGRHRACSWPSILLCLQNILKSSSPRTYWSMFSNSNTLMMYQRKPENNRADNESKDSLVLRLKNELHDLRQLQKEYINLNVQVENLEGKYELLLEERERDQRDQRMKTTMDSSTIQDLRLELDTLNKKADFVNSETEEGARTNNALNKMVEVKNKEIEQLRKENAMLISRNQKKKAEVNGRYAQCKSVKQDKNRYQDMVMESRQHLDQSVLKGKQLERQIKNRENQNARLQKRVYSTARAEQAVKEGLRTKSEQLRKQTSRLSSLEQVFDEMVQQLKQIQESGDKKKAESGSFKANYQDQLRKNKQLNTRLSRTENELRVKERQINEMIKKRNQQVVIHQKQTEGNRIVNMKLDKNLEIIYEYQGINRDLVGEIRAYCQVDERAREILNRSNRMEDVINRVEKKIKSSSQSLGHILRS